MKSLPASARLFTLSGALLAIALSSACDNRPPASDLNRRADLLIRACAASDLRTASQAAGYSLSSSQLARIRERSLLATAPITLSYLDVSGPPADSDSRAYASVVEAEFRSGSATRTVVFDILWSTDSGGSWRLYRVTGGGAVD